MHDIIDKFSTHLKNVLTRALVFVVENGRTLVEPEHLFWALGTEKGSVGAEIVHKSKLKAEKLRQLVASVQPGFAAPAANGPYLSDAAKRAVEKAVLTANIYEHRYVGTEHLLSGLLQISDVNIENFLLRERVDMKELREQLAIVLKSVAKFPELAESVSQTQAATVAPAKEAPAKTAPADEPQKTPALDYFGRDLTSKAVQANIDPVVGREEEIERVMEILCRRTKNNPLLLGEPGVGKTAIVEGLAKRVMEGHVPAPLADKRVIAIDLGLVVAGTMYRGEFEARLKQIVEEVKRLGNVVLFLDEAHQIVGAGSAGGSMDAANLLKPALARGEIRLIGATTPAEFKKHIETDSALERRFQPVPVEEPSAERAMEILRGVASQYESFHNVRLAPAAIEAAVKLSVRYLTDKRLPDKALDLVDEASASARLQRRESELAEQRRLLQRRISEVQDEKRQAVIEEQFAKATALKDEEEELRAALGGLKEEAESVPVSTITDRDIAKVVARTLRIPLEDLLSEGERDLGALREMLAAQVIGQDEAVRQVSEALRRAKTGLSLPHRPLSSFLFLGPSGVGKTELAKTIARAFFHDDKALVRLDMSEYAEPFTSSKLIGAPAGYVGYREGATLSDRVKAKPYSVVLFDELEKAHRDVQNLLLQILEEGELTDATGRKISFRNTVVVMTSNVGLERFESGGIGFVSDEAERRLSLSSDLRKELERRFRPELLNRVDLTSVFQPLTRQVLELIAAKQLAELANRLSERGIKLTTHPTVASCIAKDINTKFGARDIRRRIQAQVESKIADLLVTGKPKKISLTVSNGGIAVKCYARRRSTT
jgi:ATP-dependent Clp protease ATP-binding subunit ClpC